MTNWKRRSFIPGAHRVIFRKSGRTYFTENFGCTIYICVYIDKNVNESTTVCSLRSLPLNYYIPYVLTIYFSMHVG